MSSTKSTKPGPRSSVGLWKALKDAEIEDDIDEVLGMTEEELDADIRKNGGDPEAIAARGVALAKELDASRTRLAWQREAAVKLEAFQKMVDASRPTEKLPRDEILRLIAIARNDPRFSSPVTIHFRNKTSEACTDEELQDILFEIELLARTEKP